MGMDELWPVGLIYRVGGRFDEQFVEKFLCFYYSKLYQTHMILKLCLAWLQNKVTRFKTGLRDYLMKPTVTEKTKKSINPLFATEQLKVSIRQ